MLLLQAVEMDGKGEIGAGRKQVEFLLHEQRIGAQIDELPALDDTGDDLVDFLVQQRLAAGDRDDRRAALVDRVQAFPEAELLPENFIGIVDLAAAGAGQVTAEQGLKHQYQRIAFDAPEVLLGDIRADPDLLNERNRHAYSTLFRSA